MTIDVADSYPGHRFPRRSAGVEALLAAYAETSRPPQIWPWAIGAAPAYAFAPHTRSFLIGGAGRGGNAHGVDEFLTLDVTSALFPSGEPSAQDPFSPAAFKNLLMNAEGLLLKLQTAYKLRTLSLHEISAEKEAMSEELEEAETRAKCLKSQLDDMAHQMSMKDASIADLAAELAAEKQARAEEKLAREQSIALEMLRHE